MKKIIAFIVDFFSSKKEIQSEKKVEPFDIKKMSRETGIKMFEIKKVLRLPITTKEINELKFISEINEAFELKADPMEYELLLKKAEVFFEEEKKFVTDSLSEKKLYSNTYLFPEKIRKSVELLLKFHLTEELQESSNPETVKKILNDCKRRFDDLEKEAMLKLTSFFR